MRLRKYPAPLKAITLRPTRGQYFPDARAAGSMGLLRRACRRHRRARRAPPQPSIPSLVARRRARGPHGRAIAFKAFELGIRTSGEARGPGVGTPASAARWHTRASRGRAVGAYLGASVRSQRFSLPCLQVPGASPKFAAPGRGRPRGRHRRPRSPRGAASIRLAIGREAARKSRSPLRSSKPIGRPDPRPLFVSPDHPILVA